MFCGDKGKKIFGFYGILEKIVGAHPSVRPPKQKMEPTNIVIDDYNGKEGAHMGAPLQTDLGEHTGSPLNGGAMVQNHVHQRIHPWGE